MAAITIGPTAIDRGTASSSGYTNVLLDSPADGTGTITSVEIWAYNTYDLSGCKAGTFYGSGTDYTSRDVHTIGAVTAGSKQTFTGLSIDVTSGDYIGMYYSDGYIERDSSGFAGKYSKSGDQFGAGQQTYSLDAGDTFSLHGIGETAPSGWTGKVMGVTNPAKIMGVAVADIAKVMGVE